MNNNDILCQDLPPEIELSQREEAKKQGLNIAFYLNKALSKVLTTLEEESLRSREGWTILMDWSDTTCIMTGLLPEDYMVMDQKNSCLIDPFRGLKAVFPTKYDSKITKLVDAVVAMHQASKQQYREEHLCILEILEDCNLVNAEDIKFFLTRILDKTSSNT
jgi:hypothetical protein